MEWGIGQKGVFNHLKGAGAVNLYSKKYVV
jgi:hypothetical protein